MKEFSWHSYLPCKGPSVLSESCHKNCSTNEFATKNIHILIFLFDTLSILIIYGSNKYGTITRYFFITTFLSHIKKRPTFAAYVSWPGNGYQWMSWSPCYIGRIWLTWHPLNQKVSQIFCIRSRSRRLCHFVIYLVSYKYIKVFFSIFFQCPLIRMCYTAEDLTWPHRWVGPSAFLGSRFGLIGSNPEESEMLRIQFPNL